MKKLVSRVAATLEDGPPRVDHAVACRKAAMCITKQYVPGSAILTLRIDPNLLAALRQRAKSEGRSVSAEVTRMIRKEVEPTPRRQGKRRRTMGMFADFEAPDLGEFKRLRRDLSATFRQRVREAGRRG